MDSRVPSLFSRTKETSYFNTIVGSTGFEQEIEYLNLRMVNESKVTMEVESTL
jgi:hypothetical protein